MRSATITRKTAETEISVSIALDGTGTTENPVVVALAAPARLVVHVKSQNEDEGDSGPFRVQAFGGAPPTSRSIAGASPLRLDDLPAGTWQILVETAGRTTVRRTVELEAGSETEITIDLR